MISMLSMYGIFTYIYLIFYGFHVGKFIPMDCFLPILYHTQIQPKLVCEYIPIPLDPLLVMHIQSNFDPKGHVGFVYLLYVHLGSMHLVNISSRDFVTDLKRNDVYCKCIFTTWGIILI